MGQQDGQREKCDVCLVERSVGVTWTSLSISSVAKLAMTTTTMKIELSVERLGAKRLVRHSVNVY